MAAPMSERLFSLELLVDWVRLEVEEEKEEEKEAEEEEEAEEEAGEEEASSRSLCPAVAFRLLDFPTLLVYPPGGPAAAAPEPRPGLLSFGRGKSCLFRLHPAALCGRLLATPLYTLVLRLPPGRPTPAPRLLGTCSISLAAAALRVLGPAASCCSHGHRGSFPLHNHVGERVGHISLTYRLTDLGSSLLGHLERPLTARGAGGHDGEARRAVEGSCQAQQEKQLPQPNSDPSPRDPEGPPEGPPKSSHEQEAQRDLTEVVVSSEANSGDTGSVEKGAARSVCPDASGEGRTGRPDTEVTDFTDLDVETNTFCPPPLYYTHVTPERRPPLRGKVTIQCHANVAEELDGIFPEEKLVNPPAHAHLLTRTNSGARETPAVLTPLARAQSVEAGHPSPAHPPPEQNRMNTVRQLPLLNALLVELSVLYNQPVTSPTHIHPHLAWLYRTEEKERPESPPAKATAKSESKREKLPVEGPGKPASLPDGKNQDAKLKKGQCFEKNHGAPSRMAPRAKLLYGLTNTLKLRLKQTNPGMLLVHEKREQYRKMQVQIFGAKPRVPAPRAKVLSSAKQHQKPHRLPKNKHVESGTSLAGNGAPSKSTRGVSDDPGPAKGTQLKHATEETAGGGETRTGDGSSEDIVSPADPIAPERLAPTNVLEGSVETEVPSFLVFQQGAVLDKILREKGTEDKTTKNGILPANASESQPSKYSCSGSLSELHYSDDFTSPSSSEDFCFDDTSRILRAQDRTPLAGNAKHSPCNSRSSGTRLSTRKKSREQSFIPTPPFSARSPVRSSKRFHTPKTRGESLEEASTLSTSDLSSCWTEEKENQLDQSSAHPSKATKTGPDSAVKTQTDCRSLEKSQSIGTSQVSSYLPSNPSECSKSYGSEEDSDEIASLNISEKCKDISELLVNKLPGYTV
ncbi:microtubule-associated protein 10 [Pipistrellus kuhlii]|uniref:Microtubule associated protein 10 n=1 Tax=Pipistrellus kuhlii TaxID=59472 RepID=A0A7J7TQA9_PIPKU|nr:microtubule-associated protein 10 [Pipistrellus kuhlii]KAF6302563.1 microtubule associated protein 10 [Pipistrellus kuhlii]